MMWQNKIIKKSTAATLFFSFLFFLFFLFFPLFFLFFLSPLFLSLTRSLSFCPYSSPDLSLSTTNLGTVSSNTMDGEVRSRVCGVVKWKLVGREWLTISARLRSLMWQCRSFNRWWCETVLVMLRSGSCGSSVGLSCGGSEWFLEARCGLVVV